MPALLDANQSCLHGVQLVVGAFSRNEGRKRKRIISHHTALQQKILWGLRQQVVKVQGKRSLWCLNTAGIMQQS